MESTTPNLKEESTVCPLSEVALNTPVRVKKLKGEPAVCDRLRELGFCEWAEVKKLAEGHTMICHVCGVKLMLNHYLAKNILVEKKPVAA